MWISALFRDKILSVNGKRKAQIYHVFLGDRRTTVSLDGAVAFFLALKLGHEPGTPEAKKAVRQWMQDRLDEHGDPHRVLVSGWLKFEVLRFLVDKKLAGEYDRWVDRELGG